MAGKKTDVKLSEGEMELLKLLWELGPSPLSQVHQTHEPGTVFPDTPEPI